jgi:DNA invertase Pin-like site-specific DNA recombinase
VSSVAQRERDSIASQLRELPIYVERMGWKLVRPVGTYTDDGFTAKSGRLEKRRGLNALLRDAALGLFDVVVMVNLNRLTRAEDLAERGLILGALQHAGVRVATTSGEMLDLNTEIGDLMASLLTSRAAAENRAKMVAIASGKLTAALRGGKATGRDPYGHHYDKASNTWTIDPVRGPIVVEIVERVAGGESCISIASDLALRGVPCSGRVWCKANVRYLVRSTHPIGDYVAHRKSRTTIAVPPIVDVALWQRAQDALTANRKNGLRRTKYVYLLEGLAVCGECGAKMRMRGPSLQRGKWKRPAVYVCSRRLPYLPVAQRTDLTKCSAPHVLVELADDLGWAEICRRLNDPRLPELLAAERRSIASDERDWEGDAAGYRSHLARIDKVSEAIWTRFRRGDIEEHELDRELAKVRRERTAVSAQLRTVERSRGATINAQTRVGAASSLMERLRAKAAAATPEERRAIAMTLIDPGDAVFHAGELRMQLQIERPASARADSSAMAVAGLLSDDHDGRLRIQVVAKLAA